MPIILVVVRPNIRGLINGSIRRDAVTVAFLFGLLLARPIVDVVLVLATPVFVFVFIFLAVIVHFDLGTALVSVIVIRERKGQAAQSSADDHCGAESFAHDSL